MTACERYTQILAELSDASDEQIALGDAGTPNISDLNDPEHKVVELINVQQENLSRLIQPPLEEKKFEIRFFETSGGRISKVVPNPQNGLLAESIHDFVMNARSLAQQEASIE